jgi:heptosyltransferase-2
MNVLVFCPNWVGDAVMATPALRSLRRGFAGDRLIGVGRPVIAEVLRGLYSFDDWRTFDHRSALRGERTWSVLRQLRRTGIDLAVLLTNSFRSAGVAFLSGARRRVGYRRDVRGWLLTEGLIPLRSGGKYVPRPAIDYYLKLAYSLGCPPESYRMDLLTSAADEEAADRVWKTTGLDQGSRVVVLNPGAAYGAAKCWPTGYFADLARRFVELEGRRVLVLCGPSERELAREIVKETARPGVASLADFPVSVGLSKACVRRASLMVTTDSGPRHFASAFGVPVVTLFGPTHIEWSETYDPRAVHLQKKVPCGPCQLRECPLDHRCMRELLPAEVFQAAQDLEARGADPGPDAPAP